VGKDVFRNREMAVRRSIVIDGIEHAWRRIVLRCSQPRIYAAVTKPVRLPRSHKAIYPLTLIGTRSKLLLDVEYRKKKVFSY
jgi:hypothetical protein